MNAINLDEYKRNAVYSLGDIRLKGFVMEAGDGLY